jgi:hypothetical protein
VKYLFSACTWAALALTLLACAKPHVVLDRVLVKNATAGSITEVKVRHEPTQVYGAVNTILPQRALDLGLSGQPMLATQAVVSWRDGEGRDWSVVIPLPYDRSAAEAGQLMSLVYVIYPAGRITAQLQLPARGQ